MMFNKGKSKSYSSNPLFPAKRMGKPHTWQQDAYQQSKANNTDGDTWVIYGKHMHDYACENNKNNVYLTNNDKRSRWTKEELQIIYQMKTLKKK